MKYYMKSESESRSVMSDSLQPHGLHSPWDSPGQNTGVGSLSLLQGIFPTQGSNPGLLHCRWILYQPSHKGSPQYYIAVKKKRTWWVYVCSGRSLRQATDWGKKDYAYRKKKKSIYIVVYVCLSNITALQSVRKKVWKDIHDSWQKASLWRGTGAGRGGVRGRRPRLILDLRVTLSLCLVFFSFFLNTCVD